MSERIDFEFDPGWCPLCGDPIAACFCEDRENDEEYYPMRDEGEDDSCCLGDACLNPHFNHTADECFDLEMAQSYMVESEAI